MDADLTIDASTLALFPVLVSIDDSDPCKITLPRIVVDRPGRVVWVLPLLSRYRFGDSGVRGAVDFDKDFRDGGFDIGGRKTFGWTARQPSGNTERLYSISIEWTDDQGVARSCETEPNLRIINRS